MARKGLSRKIQTQDQNLRDAIEQLATDHDVVSATVTTLLATGNIPPGASIVVYAGGPNQTLALPGANALGPSTGAVVLLLNVSTVAVTVVPSRGDTLNGGTSISVAANVLCLLASDGVSKWLRNT